MSIDQETAARRIMNRFGEEGRIPLLNISEADVGILTVFPLFGLVIASATGIQSLVLPFTIGGFGLGIAVLSMTPSHLSGWTWLTDLYRYLKRPQTTLSSAPIDSDQEENKRSDGLKNYTPFSPDERTQDLTNIERAWPGANAIQRTDGSMEAFIELKPGNMDFATADDWARLQRVGEEFANKELDSKLKIHATTRPFPVEHITESIENRLHDEDVEGNPIFRELLEEYGELRPQEMRKRGLQQLRYYVGVEVSPLEVYDQTRDIGTPAEKLTQLPIIGFVFNPFVVRREDFSATERRGRMLERLDARIAEIQTEFVQQASDWSARRLSTVELFVLNMDFWNGCEHDFGDAKRVVRDRHIIDHSTREDGRDA